ncbi:MAG: DUF6504 family protein [Thalassobaculaceae bacterium]
MWPARPAATDFTGFTGCKYIFFVTYGTVGPVGPPCGPPTRPDHPPARFRWRGVTYEVARALGPERLAPEWWRGVDGDAARTRDYFQVEDADGRRFWLYRLGLAERGEAPAWYLHGVFA